MSLRPWVFSAEGSPILIEQANSDVSQHTSSVMMTRITVSINHLAEIMTRKMMIPLQSAETALWASVIQSFSSSADTTLLLNETHRTASTTPTNDLQDHPFIYSVENTSSDDFWDFQNCTQSLLLADRCFEGADAYIFNGSVAATNSVSISNTASGTSIASATQTSSTGAGAGSASASTTSSIHANTRGQMESHNAVVAGMTFGTVGAFAWF